MPIGKLAAMAAHAASQSLIEFLSRDPQWIPRFKDLGKSGSRILLKAKNLSQLLRAHEAAMSADLPCALFEDSGHILLPHFDGSPIITSLGIGPCTRKQAHHITKRYNCL